MCQRLLLQGACLSQSPYRGHDLEKQQTTKIIMTMATIVKMMANSSVVLITTCNEGVIVSNKRLEPKNRSQLLLTDPPSATKHFPPPKIQLAIRGSSALVLFVSKNERHAEVRGQLQPFFGIFMTSSNFSTGLRFEVACHFRKRRQITMLKFLRHCLTTDMDLKTLQIAQVFYHNR